MKEYEKGIIKLVEPENVLRNISLYNIEVVIETLDSSLKWLDSPLRKDLLIQSAAYFSLSRKIRNGLIKEGTARVEQNKIVQSLIDITTEYGQQYNLYIDDQGTDNRTAKNKAIRIYLEGDIDDFDLIGRNRFISIISKELSIDPSLVEIKRVYEGSVIIELKTTTSIASFISQNLSRINNALSDNNFLSQIFLLQEMSESGSKLASTPIIDKAILEEVSTKMNQDINQVNEIGRELFEAIRLQLVRGETVVIPGFGQFSTRVRQARTGRNPQTGDTIRISAKRLVHFKGAPKIIDDEA